MVSLEVKSKSPLEVQEVGLVEFFLNTPKPLVSVEYSYYKRFEELIKGYQVHIEKDQSGRNRRAVVSKDKDSLEKYLQAVDTYGENRFKMFGELYGYPETAIANYIKGNIPGKRYHVKYYGLGFVCRREDLGKVESELVEMYGFPLSKGCYEVENF